MQPQVVNTMNIKRKNPHPTRTHNDNAGQSTDQTAIKAGFPPWYQQLQYEAALKTFPNYLTTWPSVESHIAQQLNQTESYTSQFLPAFSPATIRPSTNRGSPSQAMSLSNNPVQIQIHAPTLTTNLLCSIKYLQMRPQWTSIWPSQPFFALLLDRNPGNVVLAGTRSKQKKLVHTVHGQTQATKSTAWRMVRV